MQAEGRAIKSSRTDCALPCSNLTRRQSATGLTALLAASSIMLLLAKIADRLEGKPHQTSETTIHNRPVTEMTTAELLRIAAQGRTDEPQVTEDGNQTTH
jgi:hypothetical protein